MKKLIPFLIVLFLISCKDDLLEDIKPINQEEEVNPMGRMVSTSTTTYNPELKIMEVNETLSFSDFHTFNRGDTVIKEGMSNQKFDVNGDGRVDVRFLRQTEIIKLMFGLTVDFYKYSLVVNGEYLGKNTYKYDPSCDENLNGISEKNIICYDNDKVISRKSAVGCHSWFTTNRLAKFYNQGAKLSYGDIVFSRFSIFEENLSYIPIRLLFDGKYHNGYIEVSLFYKGTFPPNSLNGRGHNAFIKIHNIVYEVRPEAKVITPSNNL